MGHDWSVVEPVYFIADELVLDQFEDAGSVSAVAGGLIAIDQCDFAKCSSKSYILRFSDPFSSI